MENETKEKKSYIYDNDNVRIRNCTELQMRARFAVQQLVVNKSHFRCQIKQASNKQKQKLIHYASQSQREGKVKNIFNRHCDECGCLVQSECIQFGFR